MRVPDEWQVRPVSQALPPVPPQFPRIIAALRPPTPVPVTTGFTIRELRAFAFSLPVAAFQAQLGPFALVQKPPDPEVAQMAERLGVNATAGRLRWAPNTELFVALMMEFEHLLVASLPPLDVLGEVTVGRLPDSDFVIDDPSVSKRHAVLRWNGRRGRCRVCDLGSTNGTAVNGVPLRSREAGLNDGDLLVFGDASYLYFLTGTLHCKLLGRTGELAFAV
jgi:hypothetical protein